MRIHLVMLLLLFLSTFCLGQIDEKELLGYWVKPQYNNQVSYTKASGFKTSLKDNGQGIQFLENGELVIRQNAGWCGTPPITYENVKGKWMFLSNEKIKITYSNWMGKVSEIWRIEKITNTNLVVEIIKRDQKQNADLY